MKILVYGTLRRGYNNHRILSEGKAIFLGDVVVTGYKLYNSGFPVARESPEDSITAELWDIGDNSLTLSRLDALEGEGFMYNRVVIPEHDASMYVGHPKFWKWDRDDWGLTECPKNSEGRYYWSR